MCVLKVLAHRYDVLGHRPRRRQSDSVVNDGEGEFREYGQQISVASCYCKTCFWKRKEKYLISYFADAQIAWNNAGTPSLTQALVNAAQLLHQSTEHIWPHAIRLTLAITAVVNLAFAGLVQNIAVVQHALTTQPILIKCAKMRQTMCVAYCFLGIKYRSSKENCHQIKQVGKK